MKASAKIKKFELLCNCWILKIQQVATVSSSQRDSQQLFSCPTGCLDLGRPFFRPRKMKRPFIFWCRVSVLSGSSEPTQRKRCDSVEFRAAELGPGGNE